MKRLSIPLANRELQIKNIIKYHYIAIKMSKIKKTTTIIHTLLVKM